MKKILCAVLCSCILTSFTTAFADIDVIAENEIMAENEEIAEVIELEIKDKNDEEVPKNTEEAFDNKEDESSEKDVNDIQTDAEDEKLSENNEIIEINGVTDDNDAYELTEEERIEYWNNIHESPELTDEEILQNAAIMPISDTVTGWVSCGTMTSARSYMSSVAVNNNIYTFGGSESGTIVDYTEMLNTNNDVWSRKTAMPIERYKHTAVAIDGKIYICAGYDSDDNALDTIDVYNVETNSWKSSINTPNNNTNYSAAAYNGELYIFGGKENDVNSRKAYKYNPLTGMWTEVVSAAFDTIDEHAVTCNDIIYVLSECETYEYYPLKNEWSIHRLHIERTLEDYAIIPREFSKVQGGNDGIYVSGGRALNSDTSVVVTTAYTGEYPFSMQSTWTYDLRMIRGLAAHNMVEANGYIYVFGGQVTRGTDQKLMFKRNVLEKIDDIPGQVELRGDTVLGSMNGYGDVDTFYFTPSETKVYSFILRMRPWAGLEFTLNNGLGKYMYRDDFETYNYGFARMLYAGKTYYIRVKVETSYDDQYGQYSFTYRPAYDDTPNVLEEAVHVNLEQKYNKVFEGIEDVDCFKFDISDWGKYKFTFDTASGVTGKFKIYNSDKKEIYSFTNSNLNEYSILLKSGSYYISFTGNNLGNYDFTISQTGRVGQLFKARAKHEMVVSDGNLYAVGGVNNSYSLLKNIENYNLKESLWSFDSNQSYVKKGTSVTSIGSDIYLIGGYDSTYSNVISKYNTETKLQSEVGTLSEKRERAGIAVKDNNIYVIGGRNDSGYLNTVEVINTDTGVSTYLCDIPNGMVDVQAFFYENTLYIAGGVDENGYSDKVYALENNAWIVKASMPYTSEYMRGSVYNGMFICAAVNSSGNVDLLKYNINFDSWSIFKKNAAVGLIYYGFAVNNGFAYITGGYSSSADSIVSDVISIDCINDISQRDFAIPVRTVGMEYEQINNENVVETPVISNITAVVIDKAKGIYELRLDEEDFKCDPSVVPFFFWSAREGFFTNVSDNYRKVTFYADPGTGGRNVKVIVGIGDGKGYVDKKAILLEGNKTEGGDNE